METYQSTHTGAEIDAAVDAVSGKADLATTLSGYGITDAYTKTEVDDIADDYLPLSGGTLSDNLLFVNGKGVVGTLANGNTGNILFMGNANHLLLGYGVRNDVNYGALNLYGGTGINCVLGDSTKFKILSTGVEVTGDVTTNGTVYINNGKYIQAKNTSDTYINILGVNSSNQVLLGYDNMETSTRIYGKAIIMYCGSRVQAVTLTSSGNLGVGVSAPTAKLHVDGNAIITGTLTLGGNPVAVVYSGSTAPSSSTGSNGDIYIQTS